MRNACQILVIKLETKRSLARPIYKWDNNIKTDHILFIVYVMALSVGLLVDNKLVRIWKEAVMV
jgi:hypothetical protein